MVSFCSESSKIKASTLDSNSLLKVPKSFSIAGELSPTLERDGVEQSKIRVEDKLALSLSGNIF
jgi:hypothetical protein